MAWSPRKARRLLREVASDLRKFSDHVELVSEEPLATPEELDQLVVSLGEFTVAVVKSKATSA